MMEGKTTNPLEDSMDEGEDLINFWIRLLSLLGSIVQLLQGGKLMHALM
jgi:hypothetical protein